MKLKNTISFLLSISMAFSLLSSCEIDNYDAPEGGIKGALIDSTLNIPFQSGSQARIRMFEMKYLRSPALNTPTMPDGTFEELPLFGGQYKVLPIEGAFFPVDTVIVDLKKEGITEVNFKVEPFLRIIASAVASTGSVTVTYSVSRSRVSGKITECKSLLSTSAAVNNTVNDQVVTHSETATTDEAVLLKEYTDTFSGLESGTTYYIRAAALAANPLSSYNYSDLIKVEIP